MWNEIKNEDDIREFMTAHCSFHDSCLKELKYVSGAYVKGVGMYPVNDKRTVRVIIHGSFAVHSAIEMEFSGLRYMNLNPVEEKNSCEIFCATMLIKNGFIYWCDDEYVTASNIDDHEGTVICASEVRWRYADEYIGDAEIYTARS